MKIFIQTLLIFLISINIKSQDFGEWIIVDSLQIPRSGHALTVMKNGNLFVSGGHSSNLEGESRVLANCEIYDVTNNTWIEAALMKRERFGHGMVTLNDGKILVFGGEEINESEIYDPSTNTWYDTDSLKTDRNINSKMYVKLHDGRVLLTGGYNYTPTLPNSCEIFAPEIEKWNLVDTLLYSRYGHTTTLLEDGRVLVAGGTRYGRELKSCEIYDPSLNKWEVVDSLNIARAFHSANLLTNGKVLVSGGSNYNDDGVNPWLSSCEVFDPINNEWTVVGSTTFTFSGHSSFLISDSLLLLVEPDANFEIYNLGTNTTVYYNKYPVKKVNTVFNQLEGNKIIAVGGMELFGEMPPTAIATNKCELYSPKITGVKRSSENSITNFKVYQNYPNPFNSNTLIKFSTFEEALVRIDIYNIIGQRIKSFNLGKKGIGTYKYYWNASDDLGNEVHSGIYIYIIRFNNTTTSKKMIYIK